MSQRPEDQRLDPNIEQVGPEFETMAEATEDTQWPMYLVPVTPALLVDDEWVMHWRRQVAERGRRPMGDPSLRYAAFAEVRQSDGGQPFEDDDPREGWFAEGPVDATPPR